MGTVANQTTKCSKNKYLSEKLFFTDQKMKAGFDLTVAAQRLWLISIRRTD